MDWSLRKEAVPPVYLRAEMISLRTDTEQISNIAEQRSLVVLF